MFNRFVFALSAFFALASCTVVLAQSAAAAEPPDSCFGGVISETDGTGQTAGSDCTDVIVASEQTTAIEAGEGDDVIIGGPNTVAISGGIGWDYIVGYGFGAVLFGDSGNDIIDAGTPPAPDQVDPNVGVQIDLAASVLPKDDAAEFRQAVNEELQKAHEAAENPVKPDIELRQEAIDTNPLVQAVIGTPDTDIEPNDELTDELRSEADTLNREIDAYVEATSGRAEQLKLDAPPDALSAGMMDREWGNDPITGDGNDNILYGGRGSDKIYGKYGNDLLYGGIEDDELYGNDGNDYLLGGFGADDIFGGPGDDVVQGDATGDRMEDGSGTDVLSFASGGTDGFPSLDMSEYPNFPPMNSPERGVYVNLSAGVANNGSVVRGGGGNDPKRTSTDPGTLFSDFEYVVGTPFADYIVGNSEPNVLEGGGGSDVIKGNGGIDTLLGDNGGDNLTAAAGSWLVGGPGEDYCGGSTSVAACESKPSNWVSARDATKISVGMTTQTWAGHVRSQLYMSGSTTNWLNRTGVDDVNVTQVANVSGPPSYYFTTAPSSANGQFSTFPEDRAPGCSYTPTQVICSPSYSTVTLVLAGFGSDDDLEIYNMFKVTNPILLGGQGNDTLYGWFSTDDFIHDGSGDDALMGDDGDDGLVNTSGADTLRGGSGDDLVESNSVCEGDDIGGGADIDSTSWVQYQTSYPAGTGNGVFVNLSNGVLGKNMSGVATCSGEGGIANAISGVEDLEGSRNWDVLRGDSASNQLIGRATGDQLTTYQSNDRIIANSADDDNADCGLPNPPVLLGGEDIVIIDKPANGTDSKVNCETLLEGDPLFAGS